MSKGLQNTDTIPLRLLGNQYLLRKRLKSGKRIERGLGTANKAEALRRARMILHEMGEAAHLTEWQAKVAQGMAAKGWLWQMRQNATHRSKKKGGAIDLATLEAIALRSGGHCEVSGIAFYLGPDRPNPFQPSLDRIDSAGSYDPWNLRMVCLSVNYCMSRWGEGVFKKIAAATLMRELSKIEKGGV